MLISVPATISLSPAGLLRHKNHVANAIVKAQTQHEERLGESLLDEMRRVQRKAWELLARTESDGDHRGSIVALREVRECLESLGEMLTKANTASGGSAQDEHFDWSMLSDDELWTLEALFARAANRPAWKPELLVPEKPWRESPRREACVPDRSVQLPRGLR